MIKANQIRVGNRFVREIRSTRGQEFDHNFVLTEEWMGKLFSENTSFALNDLHPIPLTPEILEKAGFNSVTTNKDGSYNFWGKEIDASVDVEDGELFRYRIHERIRTKSIQYVHQLQNLYQALTGQELEINLT